MTGYFGSLRETQLELVAIDLGCGAGLIDCPECLGDGDWTKWHPEPHLGPFPCVQCKGTGKYLVSI